MDSALMQREIGALFAHSEEDMYEQVCTPLLYPDGDNIDVYLMLQDEAILVADLGETMAWLYSQSLSMRLSAKQIRLVTDICATHGVRFVNGVIEARCHSNDLASTVLRVAQVASRVSDLWLTFRTHTPPSIRSEIADHLDFRNLPFDRPPRLTGHSKRSWSVDFRIHTNNSAYLVNVLSARNRSAARRITDRVVATWYDLGSVEWNEPTGFVSVFDDTSDVWTDKDYSLVESLSRVSRWSNPSGLYYTLTLPPIGARPN